LFLYSCGFIFDVALGFAHLSMLLIFVLIFISGLVQACCVLVFCLLLIACSQVFSFYLHSFCFFIVPFFLRVCFLYYFF